MLTAGLVTVVINVANKRSLVGPDAALPVGATRKCDLFDGLVSGVCGRGVGA